MSASGRNKEGSERKPQDFYPTPSWCTKSLIERVDFSNIESFHEPCLGKGAIFNLIPVKNKTWSEISLDRDYLNSELPNVDLIITNPPYSLAKEFIETALSHSKTVIMLLRINFLESKRRHDFWKANPPSHIITLSTRPSFTGDGSDACAYAWFVWNGENVIEGDRFQWITK